jgi:hypothetical protein
MSALRKVLRDEDLSASTKVIMKSTVLPILLFGSEVWVTTADIMRRVSAFWHSCCRLALGVGLRSTGMHMRTARARLAVKEIGDYYDHRVFTWLGRMLLMGRRRLPRQLLMARPMQTVGGGRGGGSAGAGGGARDGGGGAGGGGGDDGGDDGTDGAAPGEGIRQQGGGIGSVSGGRNGGGGDDHRR